MANQEEPRFNDELWKEFYRTERAAGDLFSDLPEDCEVRKLVDSLTGDERQAREIHLLKRFHGLFCYKRDERGVPPGKAVRSTFVILRDEYCDRPELTELLETVQETYLKDLSQGYLGTP